MLHIQKWPFRLHFFYFCTFILIYNIHAYVFFIDLYFPPIHISFSLSKQNVFNSCLTWMKNKVAKSFKAFKLKFYYLLYMIKSFIWNSIRECVKKTEIRHISLIKSVYSNTKMSFVFFTYEKFLWVRLRVKTPPNFS